MCADEECVIAAAAGIPVVKVQRVGARPTSTTRPVLVTPDGHASPNRADLVMIAFAPVNRGIELIGIFGGDGSVYEPDAKIWS